MTEPLLKRLYNMANEPTTSFSARALMRDVADEIDRLTKLVAALHDDALALRVGAEVTDLGQDCDTAIRWYRQAVLKAGKKD